METIAIQLSGDELGAARAVVSAFQQDQARATPAYPWEVRKRDARRFDDIRRLPSGYPLSLAVHDATLSAMYRFIGENVGDASELASVGISGEQVETLLGLHCELETLAKERGW